MRKIRFTEFGTVLLDNNEIDEKTFWKRLEDNINNDDYGVSYNGEDNEFTICFNDYLYKVELNDKEINDFKKGVYSPLVKKLMILSHIQMVVNDISDNKTLILDKDTKEYYLKMLRRDNSFTVSDISKYFKNMLEDIKDSWDDAKEFVGDIDESIIVLLIFLGIIISVTLGATIGGIPTESEKESIAIFEYFLFVIGGLASPILAYPFSFIVYHTMNRLERLKDNIKTKKLNKVKINSFESTILEEQKKITDTVSLLSNNNDYQDFNMLSKFIDNLLNSLKEVNPIVRTKLTEKVKELIREYKLISKVNNNDNDIVIMYPKFLDRINELELEINNAKKLSRAQNRPCEIDYLESKLEEIEKEDKGYSYKKTLK